MGKFESYPEANALGDNDITLYNKNTVTHKITFSRLVNLIKDKIAQTGLVTSISTGAGLVGDTITSSGTIKCKLKSETVSSLSSANPTITADRQYAVGLDREGYLSVNVPWTENSTYSSGTAIDITNETINVILDNTYSSSSTAKAASAKAVKDVYDNSMRTNGSNANSNGVTFAVPFSVGTRGTGSVGTLSVAMGNRTVASGHYSHSEGTDTTASDTASHAEGDSTTASGVASHAEGCDTVASGNYSHAEGESVTASGYASHAEGGSTTASGDDAHSEGNTTIASGENSHAEGNGTVASGENSHAEGNVTKASGENSHAEGNITEASGNGSHAEGKSTTATIALYDSDVTALNYNVYPISALNIGSHAEGYATGDSNGQGAIQASGYGSHAEGYADSDSDGGYYILASGKGAHAEGYATAVQGGNGGTIASGHGSHAEGINTTASGNYSHAEGENTTASAEGSHAEGYFTTASGLGSHAEGAETTASGYDSHAEGDSTTASGNHSHAEGRSTTASGDYSHAEGHNTTASGEYSHVGGNNVTSYGDCDFVHGNNNASYYKFRGTSMSNKTYGQCFGVSLRGTEWSSDTTITDSKNGLEGTIRNAITLTISIEPQGQYLLLCSAYTISSGAVYGATTRMIVGHGTNTGTPTNLSLGQTTNAPATISMASNNRITIANSVTSRAVQFSLVRIN